MLVVLTASPAGGAARRSIASFAANAGAVNGIKASRTPKPGPPVRSVRRLLRELRPAIVHLNDSPLLPAAR